VDCSPLCSCGRRCACSPGIAAQHRGGATPRRRNTAARGIAARGIAARGIARCIFAVAREYLAAMAKKGSATRRPQAARRTPHAARRTPHAAGRTARRAAEGDCGGLARVRPFERPR